MKRKCILQRVLVVLSLSAVSAMSWAYDFAIGGLYYNINTDETSVSVTYKSTYEYVYSGDVVIPSSVRYEDSTYDVTSIDGYAFYGCSNLISITIPNSVMSIGECAFSNCSSLISVTCLAENVPRMESWVFSGVHLSSATLYVPKSSVNAYKTEDQWKNFNKIISVISFADTNVKSICVAKWDTNGDGELGEDEAAAVTNLGGVFENTTITSFDELQYFTGLTTIRDNAFWGCSDLTSITIPNSVTSIGYQAFIGCSGLTSITIPNSVTSIASRIFAGCSNLTSITIPNCVTSIGTEAFRGCIRLTSITIPNSVKSIGWAAFNGCSGLTSVTLGSNVTSISIGAFYGCCDLTSIIVASENTKYDSRDNCNAIIESLTNTLIVGCKNTDIPNSVTSIDGGAFAGCTGLTSIIIPNSVTSIGYEAFYNCHSLTSITIPESVTSIGESAFRDCSNLTSVSLYKRVTSIGTSAFSGCSNLSSITIPERLTNLGSNAFYNCSGLTSIFIPENVTSIGSAVFAGCFGLTSINVAAGNTKYDSRNNCNAIIETATNTLVAGCKNTVIPERLTSIGLYAFCFCSGLTSITIPNSVMTIGRSAFSSCSDLTSITIPNSVKSIGWAAFNGCSGLTSLTCEAENVPTTDQYVFLGVPQGTATLYVPESSLNAYKTADQWKEFGTIVAIDPSAVEELKASDANKDEKAPIYDLNGRRLTEKPKSGFYIQGGKKYFVE